MCLGYKLSERSLMRYKAKGKKLGYIRIWKVVNCKCEKRYVSDCKHHPYKIGFNHARKDAQGENHLIHAFRKKVHCKSWGITSEECVVECFVKPEWIVAISRNALTAKAIVMPEYPKRKVAVREFHVIIKRKKVKKYSWE